jgi:AcrR family transcriptional regulator
MAVNGVPGRVVEGASAVIAEHGWSGMTLARVAAAAGLSRMTLHRHGLGREEILGLLARAYEDDFRATLTPVVEHPGPALERLREALHAVCDVTERHLPFLLGLDEETDRAFFHERSPSVRSREGYVEALERLLREGIADGSIRALDVSEAATVLVNATDRTYRHLRGAHAWPEARARALLVDLLLRGVS